MQWLSSKIVACEAYCKVHCATVVCFSCSSLLRTPKVGLTSYFSAARLEVKDISFVCTFCRAASLSKGTNGTQGNDEELASSPLSESELKRKMKTEKDKKGGVSQTTAGRLETGDPQYQ